MRIESIQIRGRVLFSLRFWGHGKGVGLVPKLVGRVQPVEELRPDKATETDIARIQRNERWHGDLGLRLADMHLPTCTALLNDKPENAFYPRTRPRGHPVEVRASVTNRATNSSG
jgi:hypothetical protein